MNVTSALRAMALIPTVLSVFRAVVTIFLTGLPGFVAGFTGVFDQEFLQPLSRFLLGFLTPALMFHTLATRLTLSMLGKLWPLVLWSCAQMATGLALASLLSRVLGAAAPGRGGSSVLPLLLQLAVCFQNIGAFNFPLLQTLCGTPGLFEGGSQQCFDDGVLMIFIYKIPWDAVLWTWGYSKLMALGSKQPKPAAVAQAAEGKHGATALAAGAVAPKEAFKAPPAEGTAGEDEASAQSLPGWMSAIARRVASVNPIIVAMLLGVPIGLSPTLRSLMFGPAAPLGPLGDALKGISTPVAGMGLQILSGTLGCASREFWMAAASAKEKELARPAGQRVWLAVVVVGKLIILPAVGFLLFVQLSKLQACSSGDQVVCPIIATAGQSEVQKPASVVLWALEHLWPADRLFRTVLVMEWSAPSFLNLVVICHRAALDKAVIQSVAMLYLVMYGATILTTTGWVGVGLAVL